MKTFLAALLIVFAAFAAGYRPLELNATQSAVGAAYQIPDALVSHAAYAEFEAGMADYYFFNASAGQPVFAELLLPAVRECETSAPLLALVGPDLPADSVPHVSAPAGNGVIAFAYSGAFPGNRFFEAWTQSSYFKRQAFRIAAPATGTYYLAVVGKSGDCRKYVLTVGEREQITGWDLVTFPRHWLNVKLFFNDFVSVGVAWVGFLLVLLFAGCRLCGMLS
ncbi:MAG: hypothetical protein AB1626_04230 [Candidatus Micrarchaeota archaeon]